MKFIIALLIISSSFTAMSASTSLKVKVTASNESITEAIGELYKAMRTNTEAKKKSYIKYAAELLEDIEKNIHFYAAIYVEGKKQFINDWDGEFWNFYNVCFRGTAKISAKLINQALTAGDWWEGDEQWIDQATAKENSITIKVMDGPNDTSWIEQIYGCDKK